VYSRTFRYKVRSERLSEAVALIREMDSIMRSYSVEFKKLTLIREAEGEAVLLEIYLFESWNDWRELMKRTQDDEKLEKMWQMFESIVAGEILEEDWEAVSWS